MLKTLVTLSLICGAATAAAEGGKVQTLLNSLPGQAAAQTWQCVVDGGEAILTITVDASGSDFQGQCVFRTDEP
jgi:hypothetical protein